MLAPFWSPCVRDIHLCSVACSCTAAMARDFAKVMSDLQGSVCQLRNSCDAFSHAPCMASPTCSLKEAASNALLWGTGGGDAKGGTCGNRFLNSMLRFIRTSAGDYPALDSRCSCCYQCNDYQLLLNAPPQQNLSERSSCCQCCRLFADQCRSCYHHAHDMNVPATATTLQPTSTVLDICFPNVWGYGPHDPFQRYGPPAPAAFAISRGRLERKLRQNRKNRVRTLVSAAISKQ